MRRVQRVKGGGELGVLTITSRILGGQMSLQIFIKRRREKSQNFLKYLYFQYLNIFSLNHFYAKEIFLKVKHLLYAGMDPDPVGFVDFSHSGSGSGTFFIRIQILPVTTDS